MCVNVSFKVLEALVVTTMSVQAKGQKCTSVFKMTLVASRLNSLYFHLMPMKQYKQFGSKMRRKKIMFLMCVIVLISCNF